MRRRTFLGGAGALAVGAGGALARVGGGTNEERGAPSATAAGGPTRRTTETLLPDTKYATPVHVLEAPRDGPTAVVVGGLHGDEPAGFETAAAVAEWSFAAGRLVVVPRANRPAIERGVRKTGEGDLNRQFPPGETPESPLARAIWERLVSADPDVVLDLHESQGVYGVHPEFVGQAVFPTGEGDAPAVAASVVEAANREVVPWYMPVHDYSRGNVLSGSAPLLCHKVGADLGQPAYIAETTSYLLAMETRVRWASRVATGLLAAHGVERAGGAGGGPG